MGVQDVVARLNKSKSTNTATIKTTIPPLPKKKSTAPIVNNHKMFPPSPAVSPTSTINSSSSSTTTTNSKSIASMLQKFGQPAPTSAKKPTTTTSKPIAPRQSTSTAPKSFTTISPRQSTSTVPKSSTTTSPRQSTTTASTKQSTPITKQSTSSTSTTSITEKPIPTTKKPTITKEEPKLPTPPESPVITIKEKPSNVTQPSLNTLLLGFDSTSSEIIDLFQSLVDQNTAAQEQIEALKKDVEKYASDATKVRDYEIRVGYLALKLEQVSEERDYFERELNELAITTNNNKKSSIVSPLSPAVSQIGEKQRDIIMEEEQKLQNLNNDAYMADILGVYEEISDGSDELQIFDENSQSQQQQQQEEIEILNDKLMECDRGVQITLMKYVQDLETQRLEVKALKEVVHKQDELITKLETKLRQNPDELLKEQVEVQRVELENKRELLAQLLNEREDLLRRLNSSNPRNSSLRRSSIELISNMTQRPTSYSSIASSSGGQGRGSPPLTAPPKQPLPPLPLS
jgi:predicted transcriptional regulator